MASGLQIDAMSLSALCSQHVDAQKELLEELYEDKLSNLKESLTDYYQEEIRVCGSGSQG